MLFGFYKIKLQDTSNSISEERLVSVYNKERLSSTTVWRLDESLGDYVQVLCNKVRIRIVNEILDTMGSYELRDEVLEDILSSAWEESAHERSEKEELEEY